jgi:DNA repair protein RecO (recombination protein O)
MHHRYNSKDGIVIRRTTLPNGDIVVTLINQDGKWRGVARKGKLVGGNVGKLSLFHDVLVQVYARKEEDLAVITQVQLNGALPRLSLPEIYPYAHILAELVDKLTAEVHLGEQFYSYLGSGLRGLAQHDDPEIVALVYAWRLLKQAGFAPRLSRCMRCGQAEQLARFDVAAGGVSCEHCSSGMRLQPVLLSELSHLVNAPTADAIISPLEERSMHWVLLNRYIHYHIGQLHSLDQRSSHVQGSDILKA